ncbi:hypothetical protein PIB30_089948 [Stylosanthes scabra]|uniref:Ribonuclease H1 N-terminal domain-containing protein n=1 Tax=Stylosanthes scabra TaxID=79078 RepID=A0ABU6QWK3_9FABA|nr:hypothetical protein [Stylosanthes scabra]
MSRAKYSHYTVRVGRLPGIYTSWEECNEQVHGFLCASFKGFKSLEDAMAWMKKAPCSSQGMGAAKSMEKLSPHLNKLGAGASRGHGVQFGGPRTQNASSSSYGAIGGVATWKTGVQVGTETARGGLVIEEEMELYLLRVCTKLHLGSPRFGRNVYYSQEGKQHYRFVVTLVCEEQGINVEVSGCFCADEGHARDDAAYTLLDILLMHTGHSICDWRVCVLQQQLEEMQGTDESQLARRLHEKEAECALLRKEIQNLQSYLAL